MVMKNILSVHKLWAIIKCNYHVINCVMKPVKYAPLLTKRNTDLLNKRTFFDKFWRTTKKDLKEADNVPNEYKLIYRSQFVRYFKYTQITAIACSCFLFYTVILNLENLDINIDDNASVIFMGTFLALIVILQVVFHRTPLRIYYLSQQGRYIFIFQTSNPFRLKKLACQIGDVIQLKDKGFIISPWKEGYYAIKDLQTVLLFDRYFRRPGDLYVMLGLQKDPDETK